MKTLLVFSCVAALIVGLNACNNTSVDPNASSAARVSGATSSSATSGTATCPSNLTAVDIATLPTAITTYISTNYAGATIKDARKDANGNYIVAITLNNSLTLLLFDSAGTFQKEATMKFGPAPGDSAHHHFRGDSTHAHAPGDSAHAHAPGDTTNHPHRGPGPDLTSVAVSSLPAAITSYITTNYAGATISKADQEKVSGDYVVLITTSAKKYVVLLFGSDGTFIKALGK